MSSVGHPAETTSPASEAKRFAASANKSVDHSDTEKRIDVYLEEKRIIYILVIFTDMNMNLYNILLYVLT